MPSMTTMPASPHPSSAAAFLRTAEAHELAAVVLRRRNPTASKVHAEAALGLRRKAARNQPVAVSPAGGCRSPSEMQGGADAT
jgi:hypothetical protein